MYAINGVESTTEMLDSETEPENLLPISMPDPSIDSLQMLCDAIADRQQIEKQIMNDETIIVAVQNLKDRVNNIDNLVTKLLNFFDSTNKK